MQVHENLNLKQNARFPNIANIGNSEKLDQLSMC